ncbi:MAG: hypothetical protein R6U10_05095 [Thermoplasmatota archaeon]
MNAKGPSCCPSAPRGRSGIRVATQRQENRIRNIAARLKKDPAMVLPECSGDCRRCSFKGVRKKLEKLRDADEDTLKKYADRKDLFSKDLAAAVAATMLLADAKDIPYLAAKDIDGDTYVYAKRGEANEEKLLGVQNYDDPHLRLLAVMDLAAKNDLYLYSLQDGMVCVEDDAAPPDGFVSFALHRLGLDDDGSCGHASAGRPCLVVDWKPTDVRLHICERCATEKNTVAMLTRYFFAPDIEEIFSVDVEGDIVECGHECSTCHIESVDAGLDDDMYLAGQMSDASFIESWRKKARWGIQGLDEPVFVLDGICFGSDVDAAIEHLSPKEWEIPALHLLLEQASEPLVLDDATPNAVIAEYWDDHAGQLVRHIAGSEGLRILRQSGGKYTPAEILERVHEAARRREALAALPSYDGLPPLASFADGIARAYRSDGSAGAVKAIQGKDMDFKHKAVAYAFLMAMDKASGEQWKYSDAEREFGGHLAGHAERLLTLEGDAYGEALQELLTATGSTETIG